MSETKHFYNDVLIVKDMKKKTSEKSIAKRTRIYIDRHSSIKDCIKYGIINYSALSRKIAEAMDIKNEEAVLVACRRYADGLKWDINEMAVKTVLSKSRLEIKNRISIITARNDWNVIVNLGNVVKKILNRRTTMQVIQGTSGITIITDDNLRDEIIHAIDKKRILKSRVGLVEINVKSPERIDEIPGIVSYLSSSLAIMGINAVEAISCYRDTIFIIEEKDMVSAIDALRKSLQ